MWPFSISSHRSMTKIMWPFLSLIGWEEYMLILADIFLDQLEMYLTNFFLLLSLCHELNTWSSTSSDHTSLLEHWRQLGKLLDGGLGLGVLVQLHLHLLLLDLQRDRGDLVSKDSCLCSCSPSLLWSKSKGIAIFPEELESKSCCHLKVPS